MPRAVKFCDFSTPRSCHTGSGHSKGQKEPKVLKVRIVQVLEVLKVSSSLCKVRNGAFTVFAASENAEILLQQLQFF